MLEGGGGGGGWSRYHIWPTPSRLATSSNKAKAVVLADLYGRLNLNLVRASTRGSLIALDKNKANFLPDILPIAVDEALACSTGFCGVMVSIPTLTVASDGYHQLVVHQGDLLGPRPCSSALCCTNWLLPFLWMMYVPVCCSKNLRW